MHDRAAHLLHHRRDERPVQADGAEQVGVEPALPVLVGQAGGEAVVRGAAADDVDDDVDPAEQVQGALGQRRDPGGGADVGRQEREAGALGGCRAGGGDDGRAGGDEAPLAAASLLDAAGGGPVSTRAIYERAGVQAPTLYHHFGSRQTLLDAVVSHGFREHLAARQAQSLEDPGADVGDPVDAIREGWNAHVQFGLDHPASYAMIYGAVKPGVPCGVASEVEAMIRSTLEPAARAGRLRVTPAQAAAEIFSAGSGVTLALIQQPAGEHDLGLSHRVREAILAAVTTGAVATADRGGDVSGGDGAAPAAVALGAALDASGRDGPLSPGEHAMLRELLDRLAAG